MSFTIRLANSAMEMSRDIYGNVNKLYSTIAGAVPVQQTSLALVPVNYEWPQNPGSPVSEIDDSVNSCVTRSASLAGASFLEWLFPLLVPNSSFLDKVGFIENDPSHNPHVKGTKFLNDSNCSQAEKPLLTLGELILMSRRRSCQGKNIIMHKQQPRVNLCSFLTTNSV